MAKIIFLSSRCVRASSSSLFVLKGGLRGRHWGVGVFWGRQEEELTCFGFNPLYQLADLTPFIRGGSNQNDKWRTEGA
jgi:hypothetical protein